MSRCSLTKLLRNQCSVVFVANDKNVFTYNCELPTHLHSLPAHTLLAAQVCPYRTLGTVHRQHAMGERRATASSAIAADNTTGLARMEMMIVGRMCTSW